MPYIKRETRSKFDDLVGELVDAIHDSSETAGLSGNLNYIITTLLDKTYNVESKKQGLKEPNYDMYNSWIGVLECAKLEAYRRKPAPYEDKKILENGDAFVKTDS